MAEETAQRIGHFIFADFALAEVFYFFLEFFSKSFPVLSSNFNPPEFLDEPQQDPPTGDFSKPHREESLALPTFLNANASEPHRQENP